MRRLAHTTILALSAAGCLLGTFTAAAQADSSFTIGLTAPSSGTVGQPVVIQANGISPPLPELGTVAWIQAAAIPVSVIGECPADAQSGVQVAASGAGALLAIAMRPNADGEGNFSNTLGWTPETPGQWLVCAYQSDGGGFTLARASTNVAVQAPPAPGGPPPSPPPGASPAGTPRLGTAPVPVAKPANVERPRIVRSGRKLACRPGRWSNSAGGYSYSWLVNGKAKRGASAATLQVTRALRGAKVQCRVTASGPGGSAGALSLPVRVR